MFKLIVSLGICSAFALGSRLTKPPKHSEKMVGCYHEVNESYNDLESELEKKDIDASLCSHLFYNIFVGIGSNGSIFNYGLYPDIDSDKFKSLNGRWKKNPSIKTLAQIAVLDKFDHDGDAMRAVLTNSHLRGKVVNNVVNFVRKYVFNGIDLDLSDTGILPNRPTDKENLFLLLKALKQQFDKEGFILSVSVDPCLDMLYDIKAISTYVNFINLKAFYLHAPGEFVPGRGNLVGHTSPLYPSLKENAEERKKNVDYFVRYWIKNGAPANKLILGITLNGVSYTLANPKQIGRGAPYTKEGENPEPKYLNVCARSAKREWNYFYDKEQQVPYFYKGNQIVAIENVDSMKAKAEYVNKMKLGGAVVMNVEDDDFGGKCGEKFALLKTLNRVLRNKS